MPTIVPRPRFDHIPRSTSPTLETLEHLANPWGWKAGYVPPPLE